MKKIILAAAVSAVVCSGAARSEVLDVSTIKCDAVLKMSKEEAGYLMIWLHGYYGGKSGDTTIDVAGLEESGTAIGEKCAANPDLGLMTAIRQIIGQ